MKADLAQSPDERACVSPNRRAIHRSSNVLFMHGIPYLPIFAYRLDTNPVESLALGPDDLMHLTTMTASGGHFSLELVYPQAI